MSLFCLWVSKRKCTRQLMIWYYLFYDSSSRKHTYWKLLKFLVRWQCCVRDVHFSLSIHLCWAALTFIPNWTHPFVKNWCTRLDCSNYSSLVDAHIITGVTLWDTVVAHSMSQTGYPRNFSLFETTALLMPSCSIEMYGYESASGWTTITFVQLVLGYITIATTL